MSRHLSKFNRLPLFHRLGTCRYQRLGGLNTSHQVLDHWRPSSSAAPPPEPPKGDEKKFDSDKQNLKELYVRFKEDGVDVKKIFREFYSLHGPVFVVCHIAVSMTSLAFFVGLAHLSGNPLDYIPNILMESVTDHVLDGAGTGGKYLAAYALHKIILPFRLIASIYLTRSISPSVKLFVERFKRKK